MLAWLIATALAAPQTLTHSGRMLDPAGDPLNQQTTVTFKLVDADGAQRWFEDRPVIFEDGYYAVVLGTSSTLDDTLFQRDLTLVMEVAGAELGRQPFSSVPYARAVNGLVQLGAPTLCGADQSGTLRYVENVVEVCNGSDWVRIGGQQDGSSPNAAVTSCRELLTAFPDTPSGAYWIRPGATGQTYRLWCDMDEHDGGWTLVAANASAGPPTGDGAVNVGILDDSGTPSGIAKIADADANAIGTEWRMTIGGLSQYNRFFQLSHSLDFDANQQVTPADQCKASYSASYQQAAFTITSPIRGLGTANDGCGSCVDACGGPGRSGSWWAYVPNGDQGPYSGQLGRYTNGWVYVR